MREFLPIRRTKLVSNMKNQVSPVVAIVAIAVVVIVAAVIGFKAIAPKQPDPTKMPTGPIKLPSSQVGTKLGDQTLGETFGGSAQGAKK